MEGWSASTSWTKSCWHPTKRTGGTVRQVSAHADHAHATLFPSTWERPVSPQGSAFSHCSHTLFQLAVFRGILRRDLLLDLGLPLFLARDFMFHCGDCGGLKKKMYSQWREKKLYKNAHPRILTIYQAVINIKCHFLAPELQFSLKRSKKQSNLVFPELQRQWISWSDETQNLPLVRNGVAGVPM